MPNLGAVIKAEVLRLSQKGIKQIAGNMKKENAALRKEVSSLRKELVTLRGFVKRSLKVCCDSPVAAVEKGRGVENTARKANGIRPTGKSVRALRQKFGMSQDEFARLAGVGRVTVARWEAVDGKIQFRGERTRDEFSSVMKLGKKEAWGKIGGRTQENPENPAAPQEHKSRKSVEATGKTQVTRGRRGRKPKAVTPEIVVLPVAAASKLVPQAGKKTGKVVRRSRKK